MRPTNVLRWRWRMFARYPALEQMWVNDDQTAWEWRRVPDADETAVTKGEGPPPISGDQTKEPSS